MQPAPPRAFHVSDFGAQPDTDADSGPAIRAAIAAAIASGDPAEVILGEGVYRIAPAPSTEQAIPIQGARDLTIRGQGLATELVITEPTAGGFTISNCERLTVKGLAIDYDPLPFTQGTVTAVDLEGRTFDLEIDEGYIEPDHPSFAEAKAAWGLIIRPGEGERATQYGPHAIPAVGVERVTGRTWRMSVDGEPTGYSDPFVSSRMAPGNRYVNMARNYAAAVGADHSEATFEGITLYASPGLAFLAYLCETVTVRDCHTTLRPDSGRLLSTNADGVHCRGARRGIVIEDCSFEGMSDDAINIHASPIPVIEVVSPSELIVQKFHYTLRPGDKLEAMDSAAGSIRGRAIAVEVEEIPDRWAYRVTLDRSIEGIRGGTNFADADNLYNLSECAEGSIVRGCHFKSYRGRGALLSTVGAVVSGNTFDSVEGWGVVLFHESTRWGEGPLARDVTIEGNTFNGQGGYQAAIWAYTGQRDGSPATTPDVRKVLIRGNRFINLGVPAADLRACRDVRILDNEISTSDDAPRARQSYSSIVLNDSTGVIIDGLRVHDTDPRHVSVISGDAQVTNLTAGIAPIARE